MTFSVTVAYCESLKHVANYRKGEIKRWWPERNDFNKNWKIEVREKIKNQIMMLHEEQTIIEKRQYGNDTDCKKV